MSTKNKAKEYIPRSVGKARAWVSDLPIANIGETTRRLYIGLVDFNQSRVSPVTRIEIGNTLRPVAALILGHLQRHLVYQAFPLPRKSQRIFELKQSLLLELAGIYQIAALDMLTTSSITKKHLLKSLYSAMDYMSQVLLQSFMVYAKTRDTLWHDMHHLYLLACENKLEDIIVIKDKNHFATISDIYKYVNLLALSNPYSLRQGEIEKLDKFFHTALPLVKIHPNADKIKTDMSYVVHLNSDTHAALLPVSDILNSPTIRVLDLSLLITKLDRYITTEEHERAAKEYIFFTGLGTSLAKRLVFHLTRVRNRSFNRYKKDEDVRVVTGLANVVTVVNDDHKLEVENDIDTDDYIFAALNYDVSPDGGQKPKEEKVLETSSLPMQIWHVENSSVGGYGLCLRENSPSGARVGEIVGISPVNKPSAKWQVGTIRWLEYVKEQGLCAGVEFLAPRINPITAKQVLNRTLSQPLPIDGLMLPMIEGIRPEPELVFPAQIFKKDDKLVIEIASKEETISLTQGDECTGSFSIFSYTIVNTEKTEEELDEEDYSAIWGSL